MKRLKLTLFPPPGSYVGQGMQVQYEQSEYDVDDSFAFDILDGAEWFQFEDVYATEYAFPVRNIAAIAAQST